MPYGTPSGPSDLIWSVTAAHDNGTYVSVSLRLDEEPAGVEADGDQALQDIVDLIDASADFTFIHAVKSFGTVVPMTPTP